MSLPLIIRSERPVDQIVIGDVVREAFSGMPYADGDEDELVQTLRRANALSVSLVAESGDRVVGQVTLPAAPLLTAHLVGMRSVLWLFCLPINAAVWARGWSTRGFKRSSSGAPTAAS